MAVEISGVTLCSSEDLITAAFLDTPKTGPVDGYAFEVNGWVVSKAPVVEVQFIHEEKVIACCELDVSRPDVAESYGSPSQVGFFKAIGTAGLPPAFAIKVSVAFQDGRQDVIAEIRGTQQLNMMPQRIKRCILHIGTERTGTRSLQRFLGTNRNALLQRGFFVPVLLSPDPDLAHHESLTTLALDPATLDDDCRMKAGLKTIEDVKEWRLRVEESLSREIVALSHQPENSPTLLLSDEHCSSRLITQAEIHYLRQFLDKFADETRIVVYLRPQHEIAISLYDQALRCGWYAIKMLPDFTEPLPWVDRSYFEYDKLLERWAGVFGRDKITVRLYEKEQLEGNGVIQDFMSVINSDTDGLQVPANENVSLSPVCEIVLREINRFFATSLGAPLYEIALDDDKQFWRDAITSALGAISSGPDRQVKREDAMWFFHSFNDCNERVRKDYFSNLESLFRPNFDAFPVDDIAKIDEGAIYEAIRALLTFTIKFVE